MRELTTLELDMELAEQLPARELMGGGPKNGGHPQDCGCGGDREGNQIGLVNFNNNGDIYLLGGGGPR